MNRELFIRPTWMVAVLSLCAGCWMIAHTVKTVPGEIAQLKRKTADLARLQEKEQAQAGFEQAVRVMNDLPTRQPAEFRELLRNMLPNVKVDIRQTKEPTPLTEWTVRRVDLVLTDVLLRDLGRFLHKAEIQRPPWRVAECTITATGQMEGYGSATLVLKALEKSE